MLFDVFYIIALVGLSPWLFWRAVRTGRHRRDLRAKLLGDTNLPVSNAPTVWFHGVSVGEIHLLGTLIAAYRKRHPNQRVVVSSTTDTGLAEARKKFDHVIAWPFDFSWAVRRSLATVKPSLVVLAEAEMWPNFLRAAELRGIPVAVVNARMSPRSFQRLSQFAGLARRLLFNRVRAIGVQGEDYAGRFRDLGVNHAVVTGSIKYDGAIKEKSTALFSRDAKRSAVLVAGSTHDPEEKIIIDAFLSLRVEFPLLKLILVPRHPDRFEAVATLLESKCPAFVRRSRVALPLAELPPVLLLDSVGELGAAWSVADFGYVGGTLNGRRGGQSMIEPAGYGVPTVFGPHVWNFRDAARRLVEAGGAIMIPDASLLAEALAALLRDPERRIKMGAAARTLVAAQQGATGRTLDLLDELMYTFPVRSAA